MACVGDDAWKNTLFRTNLAGACMILLFDAWEKRQTRKKRWCSCIAAIYNTLFIRVAESERFIVWRVKRSHNLLARVKSVFTCVFISQVGRFAVLGWPNCDYFYPMFSVTFLFVLLRFLSTLPPKQLSIDIAFLGTTLFLPIFLVTADSERILATAAFRIMIRAWLSVSYMRWRISALSNLWYAAVSCYSYIQRPVLDRWSTSEYCQVEMATWLSLTLLCLTTETWLKEVFAREHAAERLLASYCDTLVRLGPDLRIINPTTRLMHLMCPTSLVGPQVLADTLFSEHLATETDNESFAALMANTSGAQSESGKRIEGPAPALCVTLHHQLGCEIFVELVHVSIDVADRNAEHWIGIREIRREGKAPDESLFRGEKTSFTHQLQGVEGNSCPQLVKEPCEFRKRTRKNQRSSRSSRSSSSESTLYTTEHMKRELVGLDGIRLRLNNELKIASYAFCFDHQSQLPDFKTCLVGERMAPFYSWLQESMNRLLWEDCDYLEYPGEVWLRHPNAACASSAIVLCAEVARLNSFEDDVEGESEDNDENDDTCLPSFRLQLFRVSQLIVRRRGRDQPCHQLQALLEEDLQKMLSEQPTLHE